MLTHPPPASYYFFNHISLAISFIALITFWNYLFYYCCFVVVCLFSTSPLDCKQGYCLFSQLFPVLERYLVCNEYSINIYWLKKWCVENEQATRKKNQYQRPWVSLTIGYCFKLKTKTDKSRIWPRFPGWKWSRSSISEYSKMFLSAGSEMIVV